MVTGTTGGDVGAIGIRGSQGCRRPPMAHMRIYACNYTYRGVPGSPSSCRGIRRGGARSMAQLHHVRKPIVLDAGEAAALAPLQYCAPVKFHRRMKSSVYVYNCATHIARDFIDANQRDTPWPSTK